MTKKTLLLACAMLLSACAGTTTKDGLVYRDGSWYSPASEGHGDYYTGRQRHYPDAYDVPWAWSVGFVPYGGYCPVQYRYCTSFWADPWFAAAYYPGYYPYYQYIHVPRPIRRRDPMVSLFDEQEPTALRDPASRLRHGRDPEERARGGRARAPGAWGATGGNETDVRRPRRRAAGGGRN
jgi:hypothetical protein